MSQPAINSVGQSLYDALSPLATQDEALGWPLLYYCASIGTMLTLLNDLVRETDGFPGWSKILDVDNAPKEVLPWLAQFVGTIIPDQAKGQSDEDWTAQARAKIKSLDSFRRGSVQHLIEAAQLWLTDTKSAWLLERDTSAWHMALVTKTSETPNQGAMLADLQVNAKAAGLTLVSTLVNGWSYLGIDATYSSYTAIDTDYASYTQLQGGP